MTICFTLPYSSGGCEERRIKFDLLTAIIKCSLLAPIKGRGLMLTWLTLMRVRHANVDFLFFPFATTPPPTSLCHPLKASYAWARGEPVCVAGAAHCSRSVMRWKNRKGKKKKNPLFGQKPNHGVERDFEEVVEFTIFLALALSADFCIYSDTIIMRWCYEGNLLDAHT